MNITNLARLVNAKVLNTPSISAVSHFAIRPSSISRGGAFFDLEDDQEAVASALRAGAYAIISTNANRHDDEVAHLLVGNMRQAMLRFLRFYAKDLGLKFIHLSPLQLALAKCLSFKQSAFAVDSLASLFSAVMRAKPGDTIFSSDSGLLLYEEYFSPSLAKDFSQLKSASIFSCAFVLGARVFKFSHLGSIFAHDLASVLSCFAKAGLEFVSADFKGFLHFEPIFVSSSYRPLEFGASAWAIITEADFSLFQSEAQMLREVAKDAIIFSGTLSDLLKSIKLAQTSKKNGFKDDIQSRILSRDFRYIFINCSKDDLLAGLGALHPQAQPILFET